MTADLLCYKQMPVWNTSTIPRAFQEKLNTKEGTWAKLTILKGNLKFYAMNEAGDILNTAVFDENNQPPFVEPQAWHKIEALSDDLECQLAFYCQPEDFYSKKYGLTATHSEVLAAMQHILDGKWKTKKKVLDLGCGHGRNALYLNLRGFDLTALDKHPDSIAALNQIIEEEQLKNIQTGLYDINQANIQEQYDFIVSTVVLMFLDRQRIPNIIANMQKQTKPGGYNLIVCAMDTEDYPCTMPFSFTFKPNELKNYYQNWELLKYNEDVGRLHKTDANGQRIELRFATLLAKKQVE